MCLTVFLLCCVRFTSFASWNFCSLLIVMRLELFSGSRKGRNSEGRLETLAAGCILTRTTAAGTLRITTDFGSFSVESSKKKYFLSFFSLITRLCCSLPFSLALFANWMELLFNVPHRSGVQCTWLALFAVAECSLAKWSCWWWCLFLVILPVLRPLFLSVFHSQH